MPTPAGRSRERSEAPRATGVEVRRSRRRKHRRRFRRFAFLQFAGVSPFFANLAGFFCANIFSYFMNARVTFRAPGEALQISMGGYAKFAAVHLASLAISSIFISVFADAIGAFSAKAASTVFTVAWNYAASTIFVFRRKSDSGAKA